MTVAEAFAAKWRDLAKTLNMPAALSDGILTELQAGYGETGRHYHTDRHIVSILKHAAELDFQDREIAQLAMFFTISFTIRCAMTTSGAARRS